MDFIDKRKDPSRRLHTPAHPYRLTIRLLTILSLTFFLLGTGCSVPQPYVGKKMDTDRWAKYAPGKKLTLYTRLAIFEFTITKTDGDREYLVEGTMDGSKGAFKSINHLVPNECRFYLLLAKDGVIVSSCSFTPLGMDHTHKLPFKKQFISDPFDSVGLTGKMSVRG